MTKRLGIEGHLELFYKSIESKRQKPCESIISNLKEL